MNRKMIFGSALGAVFVFAMITNPAFAAVEDLEITATKDFTMKVKGGTPGEVEPESPITVYAFFTDTAVSPQTFKAYVMATHEFAGNDDDNEPGDGGHVHGHALALNNRTLCVEGLDGELGSPTASVDNNKVSIEGAEGNVVAYVIAQYDFNEDGELCPSAVIDIKA